MHISGLNMDYIITQFYGFQQVSFHKLQTAFIVITMYSNSKSNDAIGVCKPSREYAYAMYLVEQCVTDLLLLPSFRNYPRVILLASLMLRHQTCCYRVVSSAEPMIGVRTYYISLQHEGYHYTVDSRAKEADSM